MAVRIYRWLDCGAVQTRWSQTAAAIQTKKTGANVKCTFIQYHVHSIIFDVRLSARPNANSRFIPFYPLLSRFIVGRTTPVTHNGRRTRFNRSVTSDYHTRAGRRTGRTCGAGVFRLITFAGTKSSQLGIAIHKHTIHA